MVDVDNPKEFNSKPKPKHIIKEIIKQLHEGKKPEELKERFREVLRDIGPTEIAQVEQELINEGMPRDEIRKLCDVHLAILKESLNKHKVQVEPDHPIHVFMEEHKAIQQSLEELKELINKVKSAENFEQVNEEILRLKKIADKLMEVENHNTREENVLFSYLEKHGITEPPAIMWTEHNELKEKKKQLIKLFDTYNALQFRNFAKQLEEVGEYIIEALSGHIYKENNVLYPAALRVMTKEEWKEIKKQCDELGYCCFTPELPRMQKTTVETKGDVLKMPLRNGLIDFETGSLTKEEMEGLLNALPVDITFVDATGRVRYFNKAEERVFPRTKAIIGRKVENCHPPKSVHIVNQVIDDLKNGRRKSADFWIDMNQRKIYIRYFPVRNPKGEYIGIIEATSDITDIKKIEDERRLMNEIQ